MLSSAHARVVAQRIAEDVAAWDQAGCLSPHLVYVESGGILSAELFSEMIAEELAALEIARPRGPLAVEESAAIASRRGVYELRAAASAETKMWASKGSSAWTVVFEADARFQLSCLNRFLYVKSVRNLEEALQSADSLRGQVSSVGLAATAKDAAHLAKALARWGVTRVCQLGSMQRPSVLWRHDGRPALGSLVRWADYESSPAE
jgi:hypothetical protein